MINHSFRFTFSLCLAFVLLATPRGFAQETYTSAQLLQKETSIPGDTLMQKNLMFLKETEQGMPFIEDMEVRTETDELDFSRQEYLFRMSFNNKKARKIQDGLTDNNIRFYELKYDVLKEVEMIDRYEQIIDWYYAQTELQYFEQKKILLEDQRIVFRKMLANAVEVDIASLLKVDEDIQDLERDVLQVNLQKDDAVRRLFLDREIPENIELDSSSWITIKKMKTILEDVKDLPANTMAQALQDLRIDLEELEYDMEKAESRQILDFVQLKYAGRDKLSVQKELSLGVGFTIPTKSSGRLKINEATLDVFDEKYKKKLQTIDIEEKIANRYADFYARLQEYELIEEQIAKSDLQEIYKKYSTTGAIHPTTLLSMKTLFLKNNRALKKLEKEACILFIDILAYKGQLSQPPFVNYLSENLNSF